LLTLDGKSQAPADALNNNPAKQSVIPGETFLMNPADSLVVTIRDTRDGLRTEVRDLATGQTGFMTASIANGFTQVVFAPNATTCTSRPYAYHPMYSTSSEITNVPWAAHTFNVAFSDEIGHYNYCDTQDNSIAPGIGACLSFRKSFRTSHVIVVTHLDPKCKPKVEKNRFRPRTCMASSRKEAMPGWKTRGSRSSRSKQSCANVLPETQR
jgi:hypothetical protein